VRIATVIRTATAREWGAKAPLSCACDSTWDAFGHDRMRIGTADGRDQTLQVDARSPPRGVDADDAYLMASSGDLAC